MNQIETEQQFIERRLREENTERFRKEFQQSELLRKQREARDAEEAQAREAREKREKHEQDLCDNKKLLNDVERCPVCGTDRVPVVAVSHPIYGTDRLCIRKTRQAKACGLISPDAWDLLTDAERNSGYIIESGQALRNLKVLK